MLLWFANLNVLPYNCRGCQEEGMRRGRGETERLGSGRIHLNSSDVEGPQNISSQLCRNKLKCWRVAPAGLLFASIRTAGVAPHSVAGIKQREEEGGNWFVSSNSCKCKQNEVSSGTGVACCSGIRATVDRRWLLITNCTGLPPSSCPTLPLTIERQKKRAWVRDKRGEAKRFMQRHMQMKPQNDF